MNPVIGITAQPKVIESSNGEINANALPHTYSDSVLRAGGIPVVLIPAKRGTAGDLVDRLDGLVLSGGGDIEPHRYGASPHEKVRRTNFDRDEFEVELVREAARRRLPTLAICRGLQMINVALGGTLIQDIPSTIGSMDHTVIGHAVYNGHQPVTVEDRSLLAETVGATELMVNSIHHQAVESLAPGFRAVAWAPDGVIEGIQHDDPAWHLLAVQWHPEYLGDRDDPASHRLFRSLVEAASVAASPAT